MVNLIVNGDFSSVGAGADGNPTDWTTVEPDSASSVRVRQGYLHFNGGNSATTGSVSQDITDVPVGETINFSFDYAESGNNGGTNSAVTVMVVDSAGMVLVNQTVTDPGSFAFTFTSTTNDYTVSFIDASSGTNGRDARIDNVVFDSPFVICFVSGSMIRTPKGDVPIETLKCGDLVNTLDNGPQPIRWHGVTTVNGTNSLAPIRFCKGAIGNSQPLLVSPDHRMLVSEHKAGLMFGETEILTSAKNLVNGKSIQKVPMQGVTYHHLLFDSHEVIWSNNALSESFLPDRNSLNGLGANTCNELFKIFPELRENTSHYGSTARLALKSHETQMLLLA